MLHHSPTRSSERAIGQLAFSRLLRRMLQNRRSHFHYASDYAAQHQCGIRSGSYVALAARFFGRRETQELLCRLGGRRRVTAVAVDKDQRNRALGQEPDLARGLARPRDIRLGQHFGEVFFEQRLVTAGDGAGRMSRKIGQLDDEAGEPGAGPARLVGPHRKVAKQRFDDLLGRTAKPVAECAKGGERQVVLRFEHGGEQLILAFEMIIERALRHRRGGGDLVHADARVATAAKLRIRNVENARLVSSRPNAAPLPLRMYTA